MTFSDVIGDFSVLSNIVFLPKIKAFERLKSLASAEEKLAVLSPLVFGGKSIITHGTIYNREYLFYYSSKGYFDSNRILDDKLDSLSFFAHDGLRLVVLLARELPSMLETREDISQFFKNDKFIDSKPKVALIFEAEKMEMGRTTMSFHLNDIFDETEIVFFLGENIRDIKHKKGSLLLC